MRIFIQNPSKEDEGCLTLVDLAGSEQSIDSMYHTADRRKEGAMINSSLLALKECIRARAEGRNAGFHYRKSKLTMALKQAFMSNTAKTVILATVSPASKDTEHSLNTLRHACMMNRESSIGTDLDAPKETRYVTGGITETVQIGEVDVSALSRQTLAARKANKAVKEKTSNGNNFGSNVVGGATGKEDVEMTEKEKARLLRKAERVAFNSLDPTMREILCFHRKRLGVEENQIKRQRKCQPILPETEMFDEAMIVTEGRSSPILCVNLPTLLQSSQSSTDQKRLFKKLYKSVYGDINSNEKEVTTNSMHRRQLVTLMKMNGFTPIEIDQMAPILDPEIISQQEQQAAQWKIEKKIEPVRTFVLNMGVDSVVSPLDLGSAGGRLSSLHGKEHDGLLSARDKVLQRKRDKLAQDDAERIETLRLAEEENKRFRLLAVNSEHHSSISKSSSKIVEPSLSRVNNDALEAAAKAVVNDAAKKEKRREEARATREAQDIAKQEQILAKIAKKKQQLMNATAQASAALASANEKNNIQGPPSPPNIKSSIPSPPKITYEELDLDQMILNITSELESPLLSSVSRHGLQKQLQIAKAKAIKEKRMREKEQLDLEAQLIEESEDENSYKASTLALQTLKSRIKRSNSLKLSPVETTSEQQQQQLPHRQQQQHNNIGATSAPFGNSFNEENEQMF